MALKSQEVISERRWKNIYKPRNRQTSMIWDKLWSQNGDAVAKANKC